MADRARYDANNQPSLIAVSTADGATPVVLEANPSTHALLAETTVTPATSSTATLSNVASSATSVTILAANSSRKQAMVYNDSTQVLYLEFGSSAASTSNYTVYMAAGAYYELPAPVYLGQLTGIWASANGNARVTELT